MPDFSRAEDEVLIAEVQKNTILYDNSKHGCDKESVDEAWVAIGSIIGREWREVKERWRNLRDAYVKKIKQRRCASGLAAAKISRYRFEDQMNFLIPHFKHRDRTYISSLRVKIPQPVPQIHMQVPLSENAMVKIEENVSDHDSTTQDESTDYGVSLTPDIPPSNPDSDTNYTESYENNNTTSGEDMDVAMAELFQIKKPKVESNSDVMTEDDHFGKCVSLTLKRLTPRTRSLARLKIQQVLYDMEERDAEHLWTLCQRNRDTGDTSLRINLPNPSSSTND